jgi:hypothetical protein
LVQKDDGRRRVFGNKSLKVFCDYRRAVTLENMMALADSINELNFCFSQSLALMRLEWRF